MKESIKKVLMKIPTMIKDFLQIEDVLNNQKTMNKRIDGLEKELKQTREELKQNSLDTMKLAICSEELPLSERVSIGKKYVDKGGNGAIKVKVKVLEEELEEKERRKEHK